MLLALATLAKLSLNRRMSDQVIRPAEAGDEAGIAFVQITAWAESYRDILPAELHEPWKLDELTRVWRRRIDGAKTSSATFVATTGSGVISGFGTCGATRHVSLPASAEVALLYVLRNAQRRGMGRQLMRKMAGHASETGRRSIGLWVLAQNTRAIAFYDALGGICVGESAGRFGGVATRELGYVWPSDILARSGQLKGAAAR